MKILFEHIDKPGIEKISAYRKYGGYDSVEKTIGKLSSDILVEEVKKSGLRGRGGAGFPTGMKWSFIDKSSNVPKYLICNADEGEPGTFKDHYLMKKNPHLLIEGIILSSYALGVHTAFIYVRGELFNILNI